MNAVRKIASVLLAVFFLGGISLCMGMSSTAHAGMLPSDMHCSGSSMDADCASTFNHVSYWNHILSFIPSDLLAAFEVLLMACACLWLVRRIGWDVLAKSIRFVSATSPPAALVPRHSLQEAFANGILHPKLYRAYS